MQPVLVAILVTVYWAPCFQNVRSTPVSQTYVGVNRRPQQSDCNNDGNDTYTCGEELCLCNDEWGVATCSYSALKTFYYVPKLPPDTQLLCLIYDYLTSVDSEHFFENVTNISQLNLCGNDLVSIHPRAFLALKHLTHLHVCENPNISPSALSTILSTATLTHLNLRGCDLERMSPDIFRNATLPSLRVLNLSNNKLENFNLNVFTMMTKLKHLDLEQNWLRHTHINTVLYVRYLSLAYNNLNDFPITCDENKRSFFPNLRRLLLNQNSISSLPAEICLPQVVEMDLSDNNLVTFAPDNCIDSFRRLTSLKLLRLKSNDILLTVEDILNCFANCPNVSDLDFNGNSFITNKISTKSDPHHITSLSLYSCLITTILPETFCPFTHLKGLQLRENGIIHLPDGAFDCLSSLMSLDLSRNGILTLSPDTFSAVLRHRLVSLDLSFNSFQCRCDLLWLQTWMKISPSIFEGSPTEYSCTNIPNTPLPAFALNEQACVLSHGTYVAITFIAGLLILMLTAVVVVCHYHWHLRLLFYEMCRDPSQARRRRLVNGNFDYDIFVCYDSEDLPWVRQHLVPELEEHLGLRLCLHERDFSAGYIVDNIARCVESSKKVMMLFSSHFAKSQWCQFELSFCLRHVLEHDDALIVVSVGNDVMLPNVSYDGGAEDHLVPAVEGWRWW